MAENENIRASIGNYKGVMLCSRPNEDLYIQKEKPFISRVDHKNQLGVNPIQKIYNLATKTRFKNIMQRHREWLNEFKYHVKQKKQEESLIDQKSQEKFLKIREMAANDRVKTKELKQEYEEMKGKIIADLEETSIIPKQGKLTAVNLEKLNGNIEKNEKENNLDELNEEKNKKKDKKKKKKEKPKWAYTEKDLKKDDEKECDELLNFAKNLDYDNYLADLEIKTLLLSLKNRIDDLKTNPENIKEPNLEEKKEDVLAEENISNILEIDEKQKINKEKEEILTQTSQRSKKSIKSIRNDIEKKMEIQNRDDWDKYSVSQSKREINFEDRIAKQVADEILANYRPLKQIHSNHSIRKILENEAKKHLEKEFNLAGPLIVSNSEAPKKSQKFDASNLPYLHRHPAV